MGQIQVVIDAYRFELTGSSFLEWNKSTDFWNFLGRSILGKKQLVVAVECDGRSDTSFGTC